MKYYHVIYNSSQQTQSGSSGFGVRTFTEGTPQEYIDLLQNNDFFVYSSGNMAQPSPNALLEDGSIILRYPVTYNFAKFFVHNVGKEIYVLSRTVNVGFDYPYYLKYTLARVGNYVVDAYIFEEMPSAEVFAMLYEQPAEGAACFVPRNPVPSADNEEMKALSLDKMNLLAPETKNFTSQHNQPASNLAFEVLFAYIDAEHKKLPLLVKCEAGQAASLVADLMRLLPRNHQEQAFFFTNYQMEGMKEGYKVFFVNDTNSYDYAYTGQFVVFDATQSPIANVVESGLYRDQLIKLHSEGNAKECEKLVTWLLNPQYAAIRDKSAKTKQVMYDYIVDPEKFNFQDVFEGDDELLTTLREHFAKDKNNQAYFDKCLSFYFNHEEFKGERLVVLTRFCNKLIEKGFNLSSVIENARGVITTKLVETPETFKLALDKVGIDGLRKFFDKRVLEQHEQLLDDKQLHGDWDKIYKEFYPEAKQNDHVGIISRMFTLLLPQKVTDEVVKGFGVDDLQLCRYYTEVTKRDSSQVDLSWKRTWDILLQRYQKRLELPDANLAADIDKYLVAPLMHDQERQTGVVECKCLVDLLTGNFTPANYDTLFSLAVNSDTKQTAKLLYEKGMPLLKEKQVEPFMKAVLNNVQPDTKTFVIQMEGHPLKLDLLTVFFKQKYPELKECKKAIDRMRKEKELQIGDEDYERLLYNLGIMEEKKKKGKSDGAKETKDSGDSQPKNKRKFLSWLIGAGAVVVAAIVVLAIFMKKPAEPIQAGVADTLLNQNKKELPKTDSINSDSITEQDEVLLKEKQSQAEGQAKEGDKGQGQAQAGEQPKVQAGEQPKAQTGEQPKAQTGEQPKAQKGEQPKAQKGEQPKAQAKDANNQKDKSGQGDPQNSQNQPD